MDRGAEVDTEEEVAAFTEVGAADSMEAVVLEAAACHAVAAACTAADHRAALLEEWVLLTAAACTAADPTVAMEPTDDRTGTRAARVVLTQGTQLARTRITMRQQDRTQDHLRAIPLQVLPLRMARGDRTRLR